MTTVFCKSTYQQSTNFIPKSRNSCPYVKIHGVLLISVPFNENKTFSRELIHANYYLFHLILITILAPLSNRIGDPPPPNIFFTRGKMALLMKKIQRHRRVREGL